MASEQSLTPILALKTTTCTAEVVAHATAALQPRLVAGSPGTWPGLEVVKRSTVRTILQGVLETPAGPLAIHVKLFRPARLADRARDLLLGSRAGREFVHLRAAVARGIPAVEALAHGVERGSLGTSSFLVTATAPGTPLPRGPLPEELARAAGAFLRAAHDAGLRALDLHPGNLLATTAGELRLLDLTSASLGPPLELEERAQALAFFCQDLDAGLLDPAAAPLAAGYGASAHLQELAFRAGLRLRRHALAAFGRRALRPCKHTSAETPGRGPRWFLFVPAQAAHAAARALVARLPELVPHKSGRRGAVHHDGELCAKTRTAAAARRLFAASYLLHFCKVPTPEPVLLHLARGVGHVVVRRLPWTTLADEVRSGALRGRALERAARHLGNAIGRLHAHGLRNRDLKLENLIRDPGSGEVLVVDLDGIRGKDPFDTRGQAHDLGRLLAAFVAAGSPGGRRPLAAFARGYAQARWALQRQRPSPHLRRLVAARAAAWATAHLGQ